MAMSNRYSPLRALIGVAILALVGTAHIVAEEKDALSEAPLEASIAEGQTLYERQCGACHSLDHNRVGPRHSNTFGSKAGSVPDFRYSRALQNLDIIWDEDTLDEWLQNPPRFARGTSMGFSVRNENDRAHIIAYLKYVSKRAAEEAASVEP